MRNQDRPSESLREDVGQHSFPMWEEFLQQLLGPRWRERLEQQLGPGWEEDLQQAVNSIPFIAHGMGTEIGPAAAGTKQTEQEAPSSVLLRKRNRLPEGRRERPKLPLKHNGAEVDVAAALNWLRYIRIVGGTPQELRELVELANGHPEKVSAEVLESAKAFRLLADDVVSMTEECRAILLSALVDTPEAGLFLLNHPFLLKSPGDRRIVEREQRGCDRRFRKWNYAPDHLPIDEQEIDGPETDDQEFRSR